MKNPFNKYCQLTEKFYYIGLLKGTFYFFGMTVESGKMELTLCFTLDIEFAYMIPIKDKYKNLVGFKLSRKNTTFKFKAMV